MDITKIFTKIKKKITCLSVVLHHPHQNNYPHPKQEQFGISTVDVKTTAAIMITCHYTCTRYKGSPVNILL